MTSFDDNRRAARKRLPRFLFDYIEGAAGSENTAHRNVADLSRLALAQRVMRNVADIDLSTTLFGRTQALPIALAPIGLTGMYARRGEVQAARAAAWANIPFCLSTVGVCSIAEVHQAAPEPFWFQLYMIRDRVFMADLLQAAAAAGCSALIFTVDMPLAGIRHRDVRSGMSNTTGTSSVVRRVAQAIGKPRWAWEVGINGRPHSLGNIAPVLAGKTGMGDFFGWLGANFDPGITWNDLRWLRTRWSGPLIVKGILDVDDAAAAVAMGADGVVVSNHGGRQLDGAPSTVRALPRIVDKIGDCTTILVDGGVRSGADVLRLLALGARGVLLGRAWSYALAAGGEMGVANMIAGLGRELSVALALTGNRSVKDVTIETLDLGLSD